MFVPATEYGLGWAWVTCEKHQDVEKMLACAAERREKAAAALRENTQHETVQPTKDAAAADEDAASNDAASAAGETSADDAKCSECSEEVSDA